MAMIIKLKTQKLRSKKIKFYALQRDQ